MRDLIKSLQKNESCSATPSGWNLHLRLLSQQTRNAPINKVTRSKVVGSLPKITRSQQTNGDTISEWRAMPDLPRLETAHTVMRPFNLSDADEAFSWFSNASSVSQKGRKKNTLGSLIISTLDAGLVAEPGHAESGD